MAVINGKNYSTPRNINLRDGILRFDATNSSNPLDSTSNGLYVNASNQLIFSAQGTTTTLGAAGGSGGVSSWDGLYANDQTLGMAGATLTFDRTTGNNDVVTFTNTGAGSGDVIQITNVGTGNDIEGTNDTWHFSKVGDMTANMVVFAGDAGSDSITLTAGDVLISDGSIALTDADNAASFTITNNTATTASVVVLAGSGVFSGSTTTSFMTITPSGLTSGTGVYLVGAALTTGIGLHVVTNAISSGQAVLIASSIASTTLTTTGRLFKVDHTGNATGTGIISEIASAAADETVIFKVTASAALAAGVAVQVSGSSVTTGKAITASDLDALTTGMGIHVASAATAITTTGRLLLVDHTGVTSTSGTLVEFKSVAADETIVAQVTAADIVTGIALNVVSTGTGITSGSMIRAVSGTTGAVATNGVVSFQASGAFTSTSNQGFVGIIANSTTAGTIASISGTGLTTGVGLYIANGTSAMTTGSLIRVSASGTGAIATNGIISLTHAGIFTSTSAVDGGFVEVKAAATTAGTIVNVVGAGLITGVGVHISNGTAATTSGSLLRVTAGGTGAVATNGIVSFTSTGVFTSTSRTGFLNVTANSTTGGTIAHIVGTGITDGTVLSLEAVEATLTSGLYLQCYDGAANDFSVARYGATVIAGNAALTASLTLTKGDLLMSDGVFRGAVTATITADVGSVQGGNPITRSFNEIAVTAVSGDAITLPLAAAGQYIMITNHGAQSADVFPASGDAINEAAANTAKALAADASMLCYSYDATNWECLTMAR